MVAVFSKALLVSPQMLYEQIQNDVHEFHLERFRKIYFLPRGGAVVAHFLTELTGAKIVMSPQEADLVVDEDSWGIRKRIPDKPIYVPYTAENPKCLDFYGKEVPLDTAIFWFSEFDENFDTDLYAYDFDGTLCVSKEEPWEDFSPYLPLICPKHPATIITNRPKVDFERILSWCEKRGIKVKRILTPYENWVENWNEKLDWRGKVKFVKEVNLYVDDRNAKELSKLCPDTIIHHLSGKFYYRGRERDGVIKPKKPFVSEDMEVPNESH